MYKLDMRIEWNDSWEMHNTVPAGIKTSLNTWASVMLWLDKMWAEIKDCQEVAM